LCPTPPPGFYSNLQREQRRPKRNDTTPSSSAVARVANIWRGTLPRRGRRPPWSSAAGLAAPVPTSTASQQERNLERRVGQDRRPRRRVRRNHRRYIGRHEECSSAQAGHGRRPHRFHLDRYKAAWADLIMGIARVVRISNGSCKKRFPHEIHRRAAEHAKHATFPLGFVNRDS
jgi:hypothetical protein